MASRLRFAGVLLVLVTLVPAAALAAEIEFQDPEGDDDGPGAYTYPTDRAYTRGSFDMTGLTIEYDDESVEFSVEVDARIEDPWDSPAWNGNGFSVQFVQIYIDLDREDATGHNAGLAGTNVNFEPGWNKVVLISPQPTSRVAAEVAEKASDVADDVIIPGRTWARGRQLYARTDRSDFGDSDPATWAIQVIMQSNEGYPSAQEVLTRLVNEFEGPHRFGNGRDGSCDPHVMDILAGSAAGEASEAEAQHQALSGGTWREGPAVCDEDIAGDWSQVSEYWPTLSFIYR